MSAAFLSTFSTWAANEQVPPRLALARLAAAIAELTSVESGTRPATVGDEQAIVDGLDLASACREIPAVPWVLPTVAARADVLGRAHESLLAADHRHTNGVHYTPSDVANGLVGAALRAHLADARSASGSGAAPLAPTVCDPAVGGGAFLLAAARHLEAMGHERITIVQDLLWGIDIDPLAIEVTATALALWAAELGPIPRATNLVVGDTLRVGREAWASPPAHGFEVIVGNPPFQSQLGTTTARTPEDVERLKERFGAAAFRYADTAALFLLESCRWGAQGARVALILPQSFLVSDDAAAVRRAVLDLGRLEQLWVAGEMVFSAGARVCAPVIAIGDPEPGPSDADVVAIERAFGRGFEARSSYPITQEHLRGAPTWAEVAADLFGIPAVSLPSEPTLGSFCTATAGFRDQFYGIQPFVREADGGQRAEHLAPLITSGLIEPMHSAWGRRRTRFAGHSYLAPVVDLDALAANDAKLMAWTRDRLVPKLIVATQTRVLEAVVDEHGTMFPSVPTIALTAAPDRLWDAAAVVMAPAVTAWAMGRHAGAALSSDAIKVSARQLLAAPLPTDAEHWRRAGVALRVAAHSSTEAEWRAALHDFGVEMGDAYGTDATVLDWWLARLPSWRP